MGQNLVPLVNIKIAGKWMFIPLKMVSIGIDPYPYIYIPDCEFFLSPVATTWFVESPLFWGRTPLEVLDLPASGVTLWTPGAALVMGR